MTKFKFFFSLVVFSSFVSFLTSCGKADEIKDLISNSDAAEIIEASLQANAGGFVTNIEDIAEQLILAVTSGELCNTPYAETISDDFQGAQIQASYTSQLSYNMVCNALDIPQTASVSIVTGSLYNSSRVTSDDDGDFSGSVTGLQPSTLTMNMDGNYSRSGTQELKFRDENDITSTLTVNLNSLQITKQGFEIKSGSGAISLAGTSSNEAFSFEGTIDFNGGNKATLTINGTTYQLDWN